MENLFDYLSSFAIIFCVVNVLLYLFRFKGNNRAFKIFSVYLVVIAVIQLNASFLKYIVPITNNLFLFHFYYILQFIFLTLFYKELLNKKWMYAVLVVVLCIVTFQFIQTPTMFFRYNPLGVTITQGCIVTYSVIYFYKFLHVTNEYLIINIGLFFYLLSSILIFASGNLVFNMNLITEYGYQLLLNTNNVLYLGLQFLIFVAWWKNYSKEKTK
ncbi:MAG TPA: hypothetical protein DEG69_12960 [Flavobacteriaceae bacterium]|jgi:hypothetical protein|nr:hypothetical protein [Flavobacteriaceae bacterium]|tara:strand:- start:143935 stop:144576 length:642 start_codon:yes stop_codon:yes gene_type:complete